MVKSMKEIERIIDKDYRLLRKDKRMTGTEVQDLAKAIEQEIIKAIPKERNRNKDIPQHKKTQSQYYESLEDYGFNQCIAELNKQLTVSIKIIDITYTNKKHNA